MLTLASVWHESVRLLQEMDSHPFDAYRSRTIAGQSSLSLPASLLELLSFPFVTSVCHLFRPTPRPYTAERSYNYSYPWKDASSCMRPGPCYSSSCFPRWSGPPVDCPASRPDKSRLHSLGHHFRWRSSFPASFYPSSVSFSAGHSNRLTACASFCTLGPTKLQLTSVA